MSEHPINGLMVDTMQKIKEMIDVNTIVGNPIVTADGTTLIPISKVSFGFASGGSDFRQKSSTADVPANFGGGSGAGVTISPVSFIIISNGNARVLPINPPANSTVDRIVEMIPDLLNKVSDFMDNKKEADTQPEKEDPLAK